jgi:hypothetical protein
MCNFVETRIDLGTHCRFLGKNDALFEAASDSERMLSMDSFPNVSKESGSGLMNKPGTPLLPPPNVDCRLLGENETLFGA